MNITFEEVLEGEEFHALGSTFKKVYSGRTRWRSNAINVDSLNLIIFQPDDVVVPLGPHRVENY